VECSPRIETGKEVAVLKRRTHVTKEHESAGVWNGIEISGGTPGVGWGKRKCSSANSAFDESGLPSKEKAAKGRPLSFCQTITTND
jgi:hypothetical protein